MKRVTGLGGVFFRCEDKTAQLDWYRNHLGIDAETWGMTFRWREEQSENVGYTVWAPFPKESEYFEGPAMINYRVENLGALLEELKKEGVEIIGGPKDEENGRFAWIRDPEGNRIELWEPVPSKDDPYL
jgi:predicted enzyme related to lactoylglutathione lyase